MKIRAAGKARMGDVRQKKCSYLQKQRDTVQSYTDVTHPQTYVCSYNRCNQKHFWGKLDRSERGEKVQGGFDHLVTRWGRQTPANRVTKEKERGGKLRVSDMCGWGEVQVTGCGDEQRGNHKRCVSEGPTWRGQLFGTCSGDRWCSFYEYASTADEIENKKEERVRR